MKHSTRNLAIVAILAGALYALTGVLELGHDQREQFAGVTDYVIEAAFVAALGLSAALLWMLRKTGTGGVATGAFLVAAAGNTVIGIAALATLIAGEEMLDPVFPLGVLLVLGGYLALLVADLRGRLTLPRAGVVLTLSFVLAAFLDEPTSGAGGLVVGAGWCALARLIQLGAQPRNAAPNEEPAFARTA